MLDAKHPGAGNVSVAPRRSSISHAAPELAERLAGIPSLTYAELRAEWRRLYRAHPPKKISRDLLELGIAWKLQEKARGGLGASTRRRIADLAQTMETRGDLAKSRAVALRSGARLVREWHGGTHEVLVLDDGYRWRGKHWRSLSAIARAITGTQWSGPRFFGLQKPADQPTCPTSGARADIDLLEQTGTSGGLAAANANASERAAATARETADA